MTSRLRCPGESPLTRPPAVVAECLSAGGTVLVHIPAGRARRAYFEDCLRAAAGKRILIFCPDEDAAAPVRSALAVERTRRETAAGRDRDLVAKASCERTLAEAERELAALRAVTPTKPSFLSRILGRAKPTDVIVGRTAEWEARRAAAEAELRRIEDRVLARTLDDDRDAPEDEGRKSATTGHSVDVWTPTPVPRIPEEISRNTMTDAISRMPYDPTTMTLATPTDVPPPGYAADLALTLDAERVTPSEFATIDAFSPAHVLLGDPTPVVASSPYRNGVPSAFRSEFFADRWASAKRPAWSNDGGRIVCRIDDDFRGDTETLTCEPLLDRPEIELRFGRGDEPSLVEVAFAPDMAAPACRAWLAAELGEARPVARGPAEWAVGESIRAVWADADGAAGEWVESVPGVRELVSGPDADAPTAELRFDPRQGWTRESAEAWVVEKLSLSMSPAVVAANPVTVVEEPATEFVTAG